MQWLKKVKIWSLKLNLLPFSCTFLYFTLFHNIPAVIDSLDKKTHFNLLLLLVFFFAFHEATAFAIFLQTKRQLTKVQKTSLECFSSSIKNPTDVTQISSRFLSDFWFFYWEVKTSDFFPLPCLPTFLCQTSLAFISAPTCFHVWGSVTRWTQLLITSLTAT